MSEGNVWAKKIDLFLHFSVFEARVSSFFWDKWRRVGLTRDYYTNTYGTSDTNELSSYSNEEKEQKMEKI